MGVLWLDKLWIRVSFDGIQSRNPDSELRLDRFRKRSTCRSMEFGKSRIMKISVYRNCWSYKCQKVKHSGDEVEDLLRFWHPVSLVMMLDGLLPGT